MRQEITRATNANRAARQAVQRLLDEQPGPNAMGILVAKISAALGENLDAIREIEKILESN
jgi:predicted Zn-dependent protease